MFKLFKTWSTINKLLISLSLVLLMFSSQSQAATTTVTVNAYGTPTADCLLFFICSYTYPTFDLYVNGVKVGSTQTVSNTNQNYIFNNVTIPTTGNINIDVHFTNDAYCTANIFSLIIGCNGDRNLGINSVKIGTQSISPSGQTVDVGTSYTQATDNVNTYTYSAGLTENSALRLSTTYNTCCVAAPTVKIADYHLNETTLNGTANEVIDTADYTGGPFNGQSTRTSAFYTYPTPSTASRARSGSPGTCGYTTFNANNAIQLDSLPVSTINGDKTSVSFWMYWNGTDAVMPIGWGLYDLWFSGTNFGFNTNASDIYGISTTTTPLANGWHHVVAVFTNGSVTSNKLYIDGISKTLSQRVGTPNLTNAKVQSTLQISGWTGSSLWRFSGGRIDEVKVYNGEVSQADVDEAYAETYMCANEGVSLLATDNNLALTATTSTSYVSPWETLAGVNDDVTPTTSYIYHNGEAGSTIKTYGNWDAAGGTNWVEFSWTSNKILDDIQVFWWSDEFLGRGIYQPSNAHIEYYDGSSWINLGAIGTDLHTFNTLNLNKIKTSKIRVYMQSNSQSTGITEVRIHGNQATELTAYYAMDELTWSGTSGEVIDSSGNGYHASLAYRAGTTFSTAANSTRAISGSTGTCGYGVFNSNQYVSLPSTFPSQSSNFSMSAWINTADANQTNQRIISDDVNNTNGYALTLNDNGVVGRLKFLQRPAFSLILNYAFQSNTWYFVAVSVNNSTSTVTLYLYNQAGTLISSVSGTNASTTSDVGLTSIGAEAASSAEVYGFNGKIDEVRLYSGALTSTEVAALSLATHACPSYITNIAASNFNCVASGANAATGHLYTQLAGTAFNFDVVALNASNGVETGFAAASNQNVTVEFVDGTGSTACASRTVLSPTVSQTVSFASSDAGRKTAAVTISKAYRDLRCRVTDANQSPSVVGCSSDDFSVRPTGFTVTSTGSADADSTGTSTSLTPKVKAGANFSLTAASGVVNYDGTPSIDTTKVTAHTGATQTGTLSGSFGAASTATGSASGAAFNYSEVGYFRFSANGVYDNSFTAVDSANSDCTNDYSNSLVSSKYGCNFGNTANTNYFGRFYPDHFAITPVTNTPACSSNFTYFGQDGLTTSFTLAAQNTANVTTQNYTASFTKLGLTTWSNYGFSAATVPSGSTLSASSTAPSGTWSNGSATISAKHLISRPTAAASPTNITISAAPTDSDGVTMTSTAISAASPFRYGRLYMPNVYGSELLPLSVPIEAQYWNGSAYQRNQLDSCTAIPASSIAMGSYKGNLAACETVLSGTGTMSSGKTTANLTKPGNGNNGSVDLTLNLTTSSGTTCNSATSTSATNAGITWFGTTNPSARETFGLFKSPVIYMRESY